MEALTEENLNHFLNQYDIFWPILDVFIYFALSYVFNFIPNKKGNTNFNEGRLFVFIF